MTRQELISASSGPIIFTGPMIERIRDDSKSQTRRLPKIEFLDGFNPTWTGYAPVFEYGEFFLAGSNGEPATKKVRPRYRNGSSYYVIEAWKVIGIGDLCSEMHVEFRDGETVYIHFDDSARYQKFRKYAVKNGWQSPYFMPREAARLFVRMEGIKVERLLAITEEDAKREGFKNRAQFLEYFRALHTDKEVRENPYLFAYTFEKVMPS